MDKNQETFATWNKMANLYQDKFMDLDIYNESYDCFLAELESADSSALDLGCGPGNITKFLLSKNQNLIITGVDVAENMVDLAKKNNPTANFSVLDIRQLNQLPTSFDGVICGFAIPYLSTEETKQLISQVSDKLNTNGIFYLSFVAGDTSKSDFKTNSVGDRVYFYYHDLQLVSSNLKEAKFSILKQFSIPYSAANGQQETHTVIITKKTATL